MKVLVLVLFIPIYLFSQSSNNQNSKFNSLKILEIDLDNKLSLLDTAVVFDRTFSDKYKFDLNSIMEELIEVSYPTLDLFNYLMVSKYQNLDSTIDDGIRTYKFSSWCHRDTVDWETGRDGKIKYEIEYSNCKIMDIIKIDKNNRLIHYTFSSMGKASSEDYKFDNKDRLIEINSPKGHFLFFYDEYDRVERIVEDYKNIGNLIETMGGSMRREITYKFIYE